MNPVSVLGAGLLSLLYPPCCLTCRTLGVSSCLCEVCATGIQPVAPPLCSLCGQSAPDGCRHCSRRAPAFDAARSLGAYDGVLRHAIHLFKYRDRPQLAEPLGLLLLDMARTCSPDLNQLQFDAVLAVPMHPVRRRLRGYNQAERLAKVVSREMAIPMAANVIKRTRNTRSQVGLAGAARQTNLSGAFAAVPSPLIIGKTMLLVDDVNTTSTTLHEAANALKLAGAHAVYCLTLGAG